MDPTLEKVVLPRHKRFQLEEREEIIQTEKVWHQIHASGIKGENGKERVLSL